MHLDFANHHQNSTESDIRILCTKVLKYRFNSAFVNPSHVMLARKILGKKAKVGTIVSFPLGQDSKKSKIVSAIDSAKAGADELDVSMNVGLFKENKKLCLEEMKKIVKTVKKTKEKIIIKFIIETGYLNSKEIAEASKMVVLSGADFVKTCSGYGPRGASINDVKTIRNAIGKFFPVKVAGGITNTKQTLAFLKAGANRIGTSHAIEIVDGIVKRGKSTRE